MLANASNIWIFELCLMYFNKRVHALNVINFNPTQCIHEK